MVFVELPLFLAFANAHWTDDELAVLQRVILVNPEIGDLIPCGHGLRKLRWRLPGRGKRGGARVIYYWQVSADRVYLIYAYAKNAQSDLTRAQLKMLADAMQKEIKHG